jgi:hypothetical protein
MQTAVKDTSLMALEKVNKRLEPDQQAVLEILEEIGPAHDLRILEALNQRESKTLRPKRFKRHWEINQVTARRHELVNILGLVRDIGKFKGNWYGESKTYHFWAVHGDNRQPSAWERLPDKPHLEIQNKCTTCQFRQEAIRRNAERPIVQKLKVSEAASILARNRINYKGQNKTEALLFN